MTKEDRAALNRIRLAKRILLFSEDLDRAGLSEEATGSLLVVIASVSGNRRSGSMKRQAFQGYSDANEWARSTLQGAAAGAAMGGVATAFGGGIGAVPGAIVGGASAALGTATGDIFSRYINGPISRSKALSEDFTRDLQQLGKLIPSAAPFLSQVAQAVEARVQAIYQQRYDEIASKYGVDQNKGFLGQMFSHPITTLQKERALITSVATPAMGRTADAGGGGIGETGLVDRPLANVGYQFLRGRNPVPKMLQKFVNWNGTGQDLLPALQQFDPKAEVMGAEGAVETGAEGAAATGVAGVAAPGFLLGTALPGAAGAAAYIGTGYAYDKTRDLISGTQGQINSTTYEAGRLLDEISRDLGDPTFLQYGQVLQQVLQQANANAAEKLNSGEQFQAGKSLLKGSGAVPEAAALQGAEAQSQTAAGYGSAPPAPYGLPPQGASWNPTS